jgi:hypothetical protein
VPWTSGDLNDRGQSVFYGRAGGCLITGNEGPVRNVRNPPVTVSAGGSESCAAFAPI